MLPAPCRHGCGRQTARGFSGPIRPAQSCSARRMPRRSRRNRLAPPIRIGARWRSSPAGCCPRAPRGSSGCAALARRSARSRPAPARGWILPTAAPAFWWSRCSHRASCSGSVPRERIASAHREERPSLQQAVESSDSIAPEQPTAAVEATGHLVVEPLPESPVHAEIEPTHQPDAAAMDRSTPDYEDPATIGEAPAEFALIDEAVEPAAEPVAEHVVANEPLRPPKFMTKSLLPSSRPSPTNRRNRRRPNRRPHSTHRPRLKRHRAMNCRRRCKPSNLDPARFPCRHGWTSRRTRGGIRCASCGRWTPKAASCSAPMNSPA